MGGPLDDHPASGGQPFPVRNIGGRGRALRRWQHAGQGCGCGRRALDEQILRRECTDACNLTFEQDEPKEYIVEARFRTLEHVRNATLELLQFIKANCSQSILVDVPGPSEVDALIRDQKYCETKHVAHPLKLPPDQSFEMGVAAPL